MPGLNSHLPRRELADRDLRSCFAQAWPIAEIADFLCRRVAEIEEGLVELGLRPSGAAH